MFKSRTFESRKLEREKYKDKIILYRKSHKIQARKYAKIHRLKRKILGLPNGKEAIWFQKIANRDGAICKHCGTNQDLSINHIIPKCVGGKLSYDNLEILCKRCNIKEYHKLVQIALKQFFNQTT